MIATVPWICPSCRGAITTPYCPQCGERPLRARELTLRGLLEQAFAAFTSIDGRLLRSFRALVTRPGLLTTAFLEGSRKPYIGPISLFLVANVLFFAIESLTGGTVFSTPLASHLHTQPWSPIVSGLVTRRLDVLGTTLDLYAPKFDAAVALHARSLILLMALAFAIFPRLMFRGGRHPFAGHVAFALHLYAYMLLIFCVATTLPAVNLLHGSERSTSDLLDHAISLALLAACGAYLYVAIGRVYGGSWRARLVKATGLTLAFGTIVLGYRFALLLVTLYTT